MQKFVLILASLAVFLALYTPQTEARMTLAQIKGAMKGMAKSCIAKTGVTPDVLAQARAGNYLPDHNLQCYYQCLLAGTKVSKGGEIMLDVINKQIDMMMPLDMVARSKEVSALCHEQSKSDDPCVRSWEFCKCYYETDSSIYFFP